MKIEELEKLSFGLVLSRSLGINNIPAKVCFYTSVCFQID